MTSSPPNSTPLSSPDAAAPSSDRRGSRIAVFAMLAVASLGFMDAAYLTIEHFMNRVPPCSLTRGCESVTTSPYSVIFGVPVALLGAAYYLAMIVGLVYYLDSRRSAALKWICRATVLGFVFSLYLVYLQLFILHAICSYCMLSALSSTTLFILGLLVLKSQRALGREKV